MLIDCIKTAQFSRFLVIGLSGYLLLNSHYVQANQQTKEQVKSSIAANPLSVLLSLEEKQWIGDKIYQNECASKPDNLTYWGKGEDFPSFGIGHFIWYSNQSKGPFKETFPQMVAYVSQYQPPPQWLSQLTPLHSPWKHKKQFDQAWSTSRLSSLRDWLLETRAYQAEFVVNQFNTRLNERLANQSYTDEQKKKLQQFVSRFLSFKEGRFALIDYVNFKGLGNSQEHYQGEAWGLVSVFEELSAIDDPLEKFSDEKIMFLFVEAAKKRLKLRTQLAPKERKESRWLAGWYKRLDGYLIDSKK